MQESAEVHKLMEGIKREIESLHGENRRIEGDYDRELAVRCVNGTFVGKRKDGVMSFRGIPFTGRPPLLQRRRAAIFRPNPY